MKEEESAYEYVGNYFDVIDKLEEIDLVVNEELLTILLRYNLPDPYENFRCNGIT